MRNGPCAHGNPLEYHPKRGLCSVGPVVTPPPQPTHIGVIFILDLAASTHCVTSKPRGRVIESSTELLGKSR